MNLLITADSSTISTILDLLEEAQEEGQITEPFEVYIDKDDE